MTPVCQHCPRCLSPGGVRDLPGHLVLGSSSPFPTHCLAAVVLHSYLWVVLLEGLILTEGTVASTTISRASRQLLFKCVNRSSNNVLRHMVNEWLLGTSTENYCIGFMYSNYLCFLCVLVFVDF